MNKNYSKCFQVDVSSICNVYLLKYFCDNNICTHNFQNFRSMRHSKVLIVAAMCMHYTRICIFLNTLLETKQMDNDLKALMELYLQVLMPFIFMYSMAHTRRIPCRNRRQTKHKVISSTNFERNLRLP